MAAADSPYQVLARKWRPQCFEDVVGQEHVTRTLKNAIGAGRIHHAFLFIGSRGIGKTTTARILAKALNCLEADAPTADPCGVCANCTSIGAGNNIDVIEIDGASNNSVEDVREIREHIRMVPTNGRYKIYIIDEVHQLSTSAFNALLKTLEEPPPHGVFILATTEAHKIPATIVSRCQRFDFRRVAIGRIVALLRTICEKENRQTSDEALQAIARAAEGGVRDAESILDQLMSYCGQEITFQDVYDVLGLVDRHVLQNLTSAILEKDIPRQLEAVEEVAAGGKDLSQFVQELLQHFRNLVVVKTGSADTLLALPESERTVLEEQAQRFTLTQLIRLVEQFAELTAGFDSQIAQRIALEALLIRTSKVGVDMTVDTVMEKLLGLGVAAPPGEAPNPPDAGAPDAARPATPAATTDSVPPEPPPHVAEEHAALEPEPVPEAALKPEPEPVPEEPEPEPANTLQPATQEAAPPARRVSVTADNLRELWPGVIEQVRNEAFSAAVWLGQGRPAGIEGEAIRILFPASAARARDTILAAENRAVIEQVLTRQFDNVTGFRAELGAEPATGAGTPEPYDPNKPYYSRVRPDLAEQAAADPHVAQVLDVFKGRIADVKRPNPAGQ
ncbi:MAG: DNA polymerase III subunit gamma/tau [Candidatus Hydrogenedentota bacterium]